LDLNATRPVCQSGLLDTVIIIKSILPRDSPAQLSNVLGHEFVVKMRMLDLIYLALHLGPAAHQILLIPLRSLKSLEVNFISRLRRFGLLLCFFGLCQQIIDIDSISLVHHLDLGAIC